MNAIRRMVTAGAVVALVASCSADDSATSTTTIPRDPSTSTTTTQRDPSTSTTDTTTAPTSTAESCSAPQPEFVRPEWDRTVRVFLICGDGRYPVELVAVDRAVPDDGAPLHAAINQLLIGVTPDEAAAGLHSAFSPFTASQLRGATIDGGIATLDFTTGFVTTSNFSTSNLSAVVYSQIEATVFQFDGIDGLEFEVEGERWCGWENVCDDQPVPLLERS